MTLLSGFTVCFNARIAVRGDVAGYCLHLGLRRPRRGSQNLRASKSFRSYRRGLGNAAGASACRFVGVDLQFKGESLCKRSE